MKTIPVLVLLRGVATANAEPLDRRNVFDPPVKDPSRITQIIARLDREENDIEGQRKDIVKRLTTLETAIAALRKLEFQRAGTTGLPNGIRDIKTEAQLADLAAMKPMVGEFDTLIGTIKPTLGAIRPIDEAVRSEEHTSEL